MKAGYYKEGILIKSGINFDKELFKKIVEAIDKEIAKSNVNWVKYVESASVWKGMPSNYVSSSFEDANMVIVKKNKCRLLVGVKYPHIGSLYTYEKNLNQNDFKKISKILEDNNLPSLKAHKNFMEFFGGKVLYVIFASAIFSFLIPLLINFKSVGLIIILLVLFLLLILAIFSIFKLKKIESKK
ncbi:MAG: hypothetical protein V5A64_06110 [Candidatus Thermoplasmatota archaeon]